MIDIIVPVYNSKKTLKRLLESVRSQVGIPAILLTFIDDCSSEDYDSILESYREDLDIQYFRLEENVGPGVARNIGIQKTENPYIVFLDSDDVFYDEYSLGSLFQAMEENEADVVRSIIHEEKGDSIQVYEHDNIGLHGKIYRRSFLEEHHILFSENRSNEDTGFNSLIDICGAKYTDIDVVTYLWCDNPKSITRKSKKKYQEIDQENYAYHLYWAVSRGRDSNPDYYRFVFICFDDLMQLYYRNRETTSKKLKSFYYEYGCKIKNVFLDLISYDFQKFVSDFSIMNYYYEPDVVKMVRWIHDKKYQFFKEAVYSEAEWENRCYHLNLMNEYNRTPFDDWETRSDLEHKMFAAFGECVTLTPPFSANWGGKNVYIGSNCYINFNLSMVDDGNIYIGDNSLIGPNVSILTVNHSLDPIQRLEKKLSIDEVRIGNNVWIGAGVIIFPGVEIGDNSVIGAGSIVTKSIPANVLAMGNPCKVVKKI